METAVPTVLIRNALIVNDGQRRYGDAYARHGYWESIGDTLANTTAAIEIDAAGRWLLPGLIDDQVHFREPGLTHKADLTTESQAAAAGGVTSFLEMPNTEPPATTNEAVAYKRGLAAGRTWANYGFFLGGTATNLEEAQRADPTVTPGLKIFMGSSTGSLLVDDPEVLDRIFAGCPLLIATHCEDTPMIRQAEAAARARWGARDVPAAAHPAIRSRQACLKSSSLAVELARRHGTHLHVLHLTTGDELPLFAPGPMAGKHITAEVCLHHLWFDESAYTTLGNRLKCNPAVKGAHDRAALREAVREGRIDILATDHAPHTIAEKARPYLSAPSGLPLVQHSLLALLDLVHQGVFPLEVVIDKAAHRVADRFGVVGRGYLRPGYAADAVLVHPTGQTTVTPASLLYKCGWSPFEGHTFQSRIDLTLVNGQPVYRDGQLLPIPAGQALRFQRAV